MHKLPEARVEVASSEHPMVSIVFITYNRPHTLIATYECLLNIMDYPRERIERIVSDDGSDDEVVRIIDQMPFDVRCYSSRNQGLGANSNKGIRAASGEYVLFLQDDWLLVRNPNFLRHAVRLLESEPTVGIVMLRPWSGWRYSRTIEVDGQRYGILDSSEGGDRSYSDNPHLKRRDFHDVVGWYKEAVPMTIMESDMDGLVGSQTDYRVAVLIGEPPFVHIGARYSFNPGRRLVAAERLIRAVPGGGRALGVYRRAKHLVRQWRGREAFTR